MAKKNGKALVPKIGDVVIFHQGHHERGFGGHRDHPALVTCVHGPTLVNLKVLFDCGPLKDKTDVHSLDRDMVITEVDEHWSFQV